MPITLALSGVFTGHANDLRRMRMSTKCQRSTVVFYAAKYFQTISGVRKLRQLLMSLVFSSAGISKKKRNFLRIFPASWVVFYSSISLKSFVICAGPIILCIQKVRDVRKIFAKPNQTTSVCRMSHAMQRSSPDNNFPFWVHASNY